MISNVVVVAKNFNPSILSQIWLVRNEVIEEAEFLPGCIFAEGLTQIVTRSFDMLVVPDRLQFSPKVEPLQEAEQQEGVDRDWEQPEGELVADKVGKIIRALPHTPYSAVGINFIWHETPQGEEGISGLTRRLFWNPHSALHRQFADENARFGTYMSKDIGGGMRLKFDVKPVVVGISAEGVEDRLHLAINFHKEIGGGDRVQQTLGAIRRWNECKTQASALAELALEGAQ